MASAELVFESVPLETPLRPLATTWGREESLTPSLLVFQAFSFKTACCFRTSEVLSKIILVLLSSPDCSRTERLWFYSFISTLERKGIGNIEQWGKTIKLWNVIRDFCSKGFYEAT